jgi:hypothetical protein
VLYDGAPKVDLAVNSELLVSCAAEVVERLNCVDTAGAIRLRGIVVIRRLGATNDGSDDSRGPASCRQRLAGMPPLPAEGLQSRGAPSPDTVTDNGRNVVGDAHGVTGTCSGSDSGD